MKLFKKASLALLTVSVVALYAVLCAANVSAAEVFESGQCGDSLTWTLYDDGELVIDGAGDMWVWDSLDSVPWRPYTDFITSAFISESVSSISYLTFSECSMLTRIIVDKNNPNYSNDEAGVLFNKNSTTLIQYPIGKAETSYIIPDGVTEIGKNSFFRCDKLINVTIPNSVMSIMERAFFHASRLEQVTLPENLQQLESEAFSFTNLKEIEIPGSIFSYVDAFSNCKNLTKVVFQKTPRGETGMVFHGLLRNCPALKEIQVEDGHFLKTVDGVLYANNTLIQYPIGRNETKFNVPKGTDSIQSFAFMGSSLNSITMPNTITFIGNSAFENCDYLTSVTLPAGVVSIGDGAFQNCDRLKNVIIPNSVLSIDNSAFRECSSLLSVTILSPYAVFVGDVFFSSHPNLTLYGYPGSTAEEYAESTGLRFVALDESGEPESPKIIGSGKCGNNLTWALYESGELVIEGTGEMTSCPWSPNKNRITAVSLPDGITSIASFAFLNCENLNRIEMPDSISEIGTQAFAYCFKLKNITIPKSVTVIGNKAFEFIDGLTVTVLADNVEYGNGGYFQGLLFGFVGSTTEAFAKANGYNFIALDAETDQTIASGKCGNNITWTLFANGNLTISGQGEMTNWNSYTNVPWYSYAEVFVRTLTVEEGVTTIGNNAFNYCSSLTNAVLPTSLVSIGKYAFNRCTSLTEITIPNGVVSIGEYTFGECFALSKVNIPVSLISIGDAAFSHCSSLLEIKADTNHPAFCNDEFGALFNIEKSTFIRYPSGKTNKSYTIPEGVTTIEDGAFSGSASLTSVTIPDGVTVIGYCAFQSCRDLTDITIPNSVEIIENSAFSYCYSLMSVTIPENVQGICDFAFSTCYLTSVTVLSHDTAWGSSIFAEVPTILTLYGYRGSTTETYAAENGYLFVDLDSFTPGDINGDSSVDISDALYLFMHSMLEDQYPINYPGKIDFNNDNSIDIADALHLFMYSMLPEQYPIA